MSVRDTTVNFGKSAGKIWTTLNEKGPLETSKLLKITKLKSSDFHSAVGWLARENKILKEGEQYKSGNTNLTPEIGTNAGKLWEIMSHWGELDVPSIKRLASIDEKSIYSALGWLAREDKICSKGKPEKYSLK
jgi:hypothetical protein